jgi:hypothetical protein
VTPAENQRKQYLVAWSEAASERKIINNQWLVKIASL